MSSFHSELHLFHKKQKKNWNVFPFLRNWGERIAAPAIGRAAKKKNLRQKCLFQMQTVAHFE